MIWCLLNMFSFSLLGKDYPNINAVLGRIVVVIRLLLIEIVLLDIFKYKVTCKQLAAFIVFLFLQLLSYIVIDSWWLFDVLFLSLFMKDRIDYARILDIFQGTLIIGSIIIASIDFLGFKTEYIYLREDGRIRYNLGFSHPNALGFILLCLCMIYILKKNYLRRRDFFLIVSVGIFCAAVPNSITAAAIIIITVTAEYFEGSKIKRYAVSCVQNKKRLIRCSVVFLIAVIAGIYLITLKGIGREFIHSLSGTLYTRFMYGYRAIRDYGFTLFGQNVAITGDLDIIKGESIKNYFSLDCFYIYLPVTKGVILSIFFIGYYIYCMKLAIKKEDIHLLFVMIAMLLYGICETNIGTFFGSFTFICATCCRKRTLEGKINNNEGKHDPREI